ncbi:MAG TPA: sodium:solute symporter [Vicinamibacterales bacterium]|nr:sodium:solute symporter [Vicinamibacterales bacterium]
MQLVDWAVVFAYLAWVISDGIRRTKNAREIEGYFLANRSLPWWAVGLSVMATQLSAITLVGTTGQGYADGLRFVQFYFGLPLAMIVLCLTVVPFFHRAKVFTAYEYLERRFDAKTRSLTSLLFLVSRCLACGVVISAPAVILSIVLGWSLTFTVMLIGVPTTIYTMLGGVQAVTWADVKQMAVIVCGVLATVVVLIMGLPDDVSVGAALHTAGAVGRMQTVDFTFDVTTQYTFWSGLIGGMFLAMGYFGADQSQVQRYLTAKSVDEGRSSLLMSAYVKIPLQVLILLTGVLVFCFYLYTPPPMLFNPKHQAVLESGPAASEYQALQGEFAGAFERRREAARAVAANRSDDASKAAFANADGEVKAIRDRALGLVRETTGDLAYSDVNYVFPTFILTQLPIGLAGLMIAAILAAVMSTVAAELNSLSTATIIDFYRRHFRKSASDRHYLRASWAATAMWGAFATVVATYATSLGSLIEVVNKVGSFFYGSLFGVFVLAIGTKRVGANAAFIALIAGMVTVALVGFFTPVSWLWQNVVGTVVVVAVGVALSYVFRETVKSA